MLRDTQDNCQSSNKGWEERVLAEEVGRSGFITWLRNVDRKDWALQIPYLVLGKWKPLYPDFLVFREVDGKIVVDVIDPHRPDTEAASKCHRLTNLK